MADVRARLMGAAIALLSGAFLLLTWWLSHPQQTQLVSPGPTEGGSFGATWPRIPAYQPYTVNLVARLCVRGPTSARIERVVLVGATGQHVEGFAMRVPPSSPSVDMAPGVLSQNGFPKAGGQVTVSAHCYDGDDPMRTADGSLEIAIQLVRTSVTTGSSRAVRIDYRDERGQRSSLTIPFEITLCSLLDDVTPGCH